MIEYARASGIRALLLVDFFCFCVLVLGLCFFVVCDRVVGMSGLFFNYGGVLHELVLSCVDGVSVWRGVVDGCEEVFWDSGVGVDEVDLVLVFRGLVDVWVGER